MSTAYADMIRKNLNESGSMRAGAMIGGCGYGGGYLGGAVLRPPMNREQRQAERAEKKNDPLYAERLARYHAAAPKIKAGMELARATKYQFLKNWYDGELARTGKEPTGHDIKVKRAEINLEAAMQKRAVGSKKGQVAAAMKKMTPEELTKFNATKVSLTPQQKAAAKARRDLVMSAIRRK
jgi:hypothetical protein